MSAATSAPHVLVYDDDQATLDLYRDLLTDAGYRVTVRDRMSDDPAVAAQLRPSLILLDLIFAGADAGWQFIEAAKRHPASAEIPILVCTAAAQLVDDLKDQIDELSCRVVLKPFDIDDLLEAVSVCLERLDHDRATG